MEAGHDRFLTFVNEWMNEWMNEWIPLFKFETKIEVEEQLHEDTIN